MKRMACNSGILFGKLFEIHLSDAQKNFVHMYMLSFLETDPYFQCCLNLKWHTYSKHLPMHSKYTCITG